MNIHTLSSLDTVYNADCIDFCPIDNFQNLIIVGTYEHERKAEKCSRTGQLYLLQQEEEDIQILQQIEMPGILDVRWCIQKLSEKVIVGLVDAEGYLVIYCLDQYCLNEICRVRSCLEISLYLDWSTRIKVDNTPLICVSNSKGCLNLYSFSESEIQHIQEIKAHDFEAWVTCFNYWNPHILYSGGDDCKFLGFDIRSKATPIFKLSDHVAGVTSIQPSLWKEELLFTGCYEGDLISWDCRNMKSFLSKTNLGGGVWRLRCEPNNKPLMLASTMHNGFQVLEVDEKDNSTIIGTYSEHKSLAYGADWSWKESSEHRVGSVSFYDHLMCLWEFDKTK